MRKSRAAYAAAVITLAALSIGCAAGLGSHGGVRPAPPITAVQVSPEGKGRLAIEDFRGRPLVLNIGAVWCPHCLHELPAFKAAYEKFKDDAAFAVVFIKSERESIDKLLFDQPLPFVVGHDETSETGRAYGIKGIPVTYFIDADGRITDEYVGGITESRLFEKTGELISRSGPRAVK